MLQEKDVPKPWIKIIDFGLAQQLEDGITFKSLCGTPQYIAPEVINYETWGQQAELSGLSPFQGETDAETLSNVVAGTYEFEEHCFSQTSEMAKDFIRQLLVKEPEHRMTASECLVHPWIKPVSRKQALSRSRSSINMRNFRKFNARRKWKVNGPLGSSGWAPFQGWLHLRDGCSAMGGEVELGRDPYLGLSLFLSPSSPTTQCLPATGSAACSCSATSGRRTRSW
uniref:Protein kinase domain-containing protein n=1 Tax=Zosterops lateralis melanops TaxID=1220523 RepID=A0A8D2NQC6_ZOSLA